MNIVRFACCIALGVFATSCKEQEALFKELKACRAEMDEIRAQSSEIQRQINQANQERDSLRYNPLVRQSPVAFESKLNDLRGEVTKLNDQKMAIELEVNKLSKELADYRAQR